VSAISAVAACCAEEQSGASDNTPLDYNDLIAFLDGEQDVAHSSNEVSSWTDQHASLAFTVPSGQRAPLRLPSTQNGLDGVSFEEADSGAGAIRRKLQSANSVFDNFFSGSGNKIISFAARLDDLVNSFSTNNTIVSKGFSDSNGWRLNIQADGTIQFNHRRSDGSTWTLSASGFYNEGDLVLGSLTYNGGNSSGSGSFRLYNGSTFITTGSVTVGAVSGIGTESTKNLIVGNVLDTADANINAPFGGPILGLWMTKPGSRVFDDNYMGQWIP
jgi:hypothetical protein